METIAREAERDAVARWLSSRQPPVLLLEGEAGIGKSTLWRAAVEEAELQRYRLLTCGAADSETRLASPRSAICWRPTSRTSPTSFRSRSAARSR
jgi:MoxR-like ATPase